ncbi:MAG: BrxA/BrxB family bacilliredoxin [Melioribacteraceae bacterium]|nr:BrxA/BrxB family bacilliredoxin [Melioribacteraceae bacterium]
MYNINIKPPIYDPEAVQPMRDELLYVGFKELTTPQMVSDILAPKSNETVLVLINSVCGCAAGSARPGVALSLQNAIIPDKLATIFAGQDRDSLDLFREKYLTGVAPSSPFIALFKDGEPIFLMPRYGIEGRSAEEISADLVAEYDKFCKGVGPSISPEKYAKLEYFISCGSKIPLNEE